jgi:hypothetical protein
MMVFFLFFGFDAVEYIIDAKYTYVDGYWLVHFTQFLLALCAVICLHSGFWFVNITPITLCNKLDV